MYKKTVQFMKAESNFFLKGFQNLYKSCGDKVAPGLDFSPLTGTEEASVIKYYGQQYQRLH